MVGWFYINDEVAAPVRMLEIDAASGAVTIEIAARFVPNHTMLRRQTIVEYRDWSERRQVRCLGAERVGNALMIEAVDVGPANEQADDPTDRPEDWLAIDGRACCQITGLQMSDQPGGHGLFHVRLDDWRDLRIGENAPLASVGIALHACQDTDNSITPLLHVAHEPASGATLPLVEIIRLRERERLIISPMATDWRDETTLVVARIHERLPLRRAVKSEAVGV